MKRRWVKWVSWIVLTPLLLFILLMVLLYVPPIQNLLKREATAYASEATGMQIQVDRIDLRFPLNLLVRGVQVVQAPDTLLTLESLSVSVKVWPLLQGKAEVDQVSLRKAHVNSAGLMGNMQIEGVLGRFNLRVNADLEQEVALIQRVELSDTHVRMTMRNDTTTTPKDSAQTALRWNIALRDLNLKNVSFLLLMPDDSIRTGGHIGEAILKDAEADLGRNVYGWQKFMLSGASATYYMGSGDAVPGFDPSHILVRDIRLGVDSVFYGEKKLSATIRECSLSERSGLRIDTLAGRMRTQGNGIEVPYVRLKTTHSEINFSLKTGWDLANILTSGELSTRFNAYIGKQDVMLFAGSLPATFKEAYPFRPLVVQAGVEGSLDHMQISQLRAELPGAFSLRGGGELKHITDSLNRSAKVDLNLVTGNLHFLTALTGMGDRLAIPDSIRLKAQLGMEGKAYKAKMDMQEGRGDVSLDALFDQVTEAYQADLKVTGMQLHHFLPKDSIYEFAATASLKGRGVDVTSYRSAAVVKATVDTLHYGRYHLANVTLDGNLKNAVAAARLSSDNELVRLTAEGEYNLAHRYPDGKVTVNATHVNLYEMGLLPELQKHPLMFRLEAEARKELVSAKLTSGDLSLDFTAGAGVDPLIKQSQKFVDLLMVQLKNKLLDHAALRKELPTARITFTAGKENPLAWYLARSNIGYNDVAVRFNASPERGINGRAALTALKIDTLQLDTVYFSARQDTSHVRLRGGVINTPKNPHISFKAGITGQIRTNDAELTLDFENAKGETGLLLGVKARPRRSGDGLVINVIPDEPIVAFRKFKFKDNNNWLYLHNNMRVYASIDMEGTEGTGFKMQSVREDTVSLQNMHVEFIRLRLAELSELLPYYPEVSGLLSAEVHYVQKPDAPFEVSAEATVDELAYQKQRIGDVTLGATWLPGEGGKQHINTYLTHEDEEILTADGALYPLGPGKDSVVVNLNVEHFPLRIANAFIPDQMATLSGDLDGELHLTGSSAKPLLNGQLLLDSVSVYARQAGIRLTFDDRPVKLNNSRAVFDKFAIYTTSKNPFTIDGYVDFRDMSKPTANLKLDAKNYTLLSAPRTRESLVYGRVYVDFNSTLRGPLNALVMRGNMNLLGNTDVTYVLTDSPLSVQDRLGDLVTFVSFSDTTSLRKEEQQQLSLGGMDLIMTIHIEPAVRLKADLSADRSSRVELMGGGDLSLKYSPRGDMTLFGRYTLSGGMMKYALPVIPLKEFQIKNGSYVEWTGDLMDPMLNFRATERTRSSVANDDGSSRMVNFDLSVVVRNRLDDLVLAFEIEAPDDTGVQAELASKGADERNQLAVAMLATGLYLPDVGKTSGGGLNMGNALNSLLASQINSVLGNSIKGGSFAVGVEGREDSGNRQTDFTFKYSQRLFSDRVQVVLGGRVSTGANAQNDAESFIDNISVEYRLDAAGTRYLRLFHDKTYDNLDGEITETGLGLVLRKKLDRLSELFIFKKKK